MQRTFLLVGLVIASFGVCAHAAEPFLPEILGAPGSNESYLGRGPDGRIWFARADASFTTSVVLSCALKRDSCVDVRPAFEHASAYDAGATFSADGRTLIFTSKRPGLGDEWNLWRSRFDGVSWSAPQPLPSPINSPKAECCAVIAPDGSLFFASERDASWDIYVAPASGDGYGTPVKLPASVNSDGMEWPAWISPDASTLLFSSIRKGGVGGDDIYVACRDGTAWREARILGPAVNSPAYEDSPRVESGYFYFSSTRPRADGDASANVYRTPTPPSC
jgi:hypothetical protein